VKRTETKIFDPANGFGPLRDVVKVSDPTVVKRGHRWWLYGAAEVAGRPGIQLVSASLPEGAPLSASGWALTPDLEDPHRVALTGPRRSRSCRRTIEAGTQAPGAVPSLQRDRAGSAARVLQRHLLAERWQPIPVCLHHWLPRARSPAAMTIGTAALTICRPSRGSA